MKPTIKEMQERIYCEISETNGTINWVSFYDTEDEYECRFAFPNDFTSEEIEEVETLVATGNNNEYDWRNWEDKVIENHYNEIEEIEEEEEVFLRNWELSILRNRMK